MPDENGQQLERYGVVSHPEGRAEIAMVGRVEVKLDTLDDGPAFEDGWIEISTLKQVLKNQDDVRYRPPDCDDPDQALTELNQR